MFSHFNLFPYDIVVDVAWVYYGLAFAIFSFIVAVFLEARVMKGYFPTVTQGAILSHRIALPFTQRLKYSFIINTISTLAGLPLAYYALWHMQLDDYFVWIVYAFFLTLVVEFFSLIFIVRPKPVFCEALRFTILSNLASYAVIVTIGWIIPSPLWTAILMACVVLFRR